MTDIGLYLALAACGSMVLGLGLLAMVLLELRRDHKRIAEPMRAPEVLLPPEPDPGARTPTHREVRGAMSLPDPADRLDELEFLSRSDWGPRRWPD